MNICFCILALNIGGAEKMMLRLASEFRRENGIVVLSFFDGPLRFQLEEQGIEVNVLARRNFFSFAFGLFKSFIFLRKRRFDVVQTWMFHADLIFGLIAWCLRIPVIWNVRHSTFTEDELNFKWRVVLFFHRKLAFYIPTSIIICSMVAHKFFVSLGYPKKKIIFIPNGYKTGVSGRGLPSFKRFRDAGPVVFGLAGRWHPQKNFSAFLQAAAKLSEEFSGFNIKMCGPLINSDNLELSCLMRDVSVSVDLLGVIENMVDFYESIDFLVMCSRSGEAFPNVVAEAMLAGTPTLVTDVGDALYIQSGFGLFIEDLDNVDSIYRSMKDAVEISDSVYYGFSNGGKSSALSRFDILRVSDLYLSVYRQTLS